MIKRYEFYDRNDDAARAHVESNGDYVTHADYAALQAKADAMEAALAEAQYGLSWALAKAIYENPPYFNDPCPPVTRGYNAARIALAQHGKDKTK